MTNAAGKPGDAPAEAEFDHVAIEIKPLAPPLPPTGLTATATLDEAVELSWKNPPYAHLGIKVEASLNDGPFYEIADLAASVASFVNTGLRNPAALHYRVRAYHTGGYSAYSEVAAIQPGGPK